MTAVNEINEEIGQLLSFTSYGKMKLDTLASQINIFEKNLRKVASRSMLRQLEQEVDIFNVTLVMTLDTIEQWQQKVAKLQQSIQHERCLPKKLTHKIKRLENTLTSQQNRTRDLQTRYQRLAKNIREKARAVKPNIIMGRQPLAQTG